jgi:hypothetical protein
MNSKLEDTIILLSILVGGIAYSIYLYKNPKETLKGFGSGMLIPFFRTDKGIKVLLVFQIGMLSFFLLLILFPSLVYFIPLPFK